MAIRLGARTTHMPDRTFNAFELRRLEWDTSHFGRKMGVLAFTAADRKMGEHALTADLQFALGEATDDGYEHLILRVPATDLRLARVAEQSGLRLVDVAVDHTINLGGRQPLSVSGTGIRQAKPSDVDVLREIAAASFEYSRFAADAFFSAEQVADFHEQWVTNLCDGLAKIVLVAEAADEIAGFTSCSLMQDGSGRIPLIATSEAHRRQGVGRALVDASLRWFSAAGIKKAHVKTQAANYPALALYHRVGFTITSTELTFSATLDGTGSAAG